MGHRKLTAGFHHTTYQSTNQYLPIDMPLICTLFLISDTITAIQV